MSDCQRCELLRKMGEDLLKERNEARAIAHARGLDASELEVENRRLREKLERIRDCAPSDSKGHPSWASGIARRALEDKP